MVVWEGRKGFRTGRERSSVRESFAIAGKECDVTGPGYVKRGETTFS